MVVINCIVKTKDEPKIENVKVTILVSFVLTHLSNTSITLTHTLSKFFNHRKKLGLE